MSDIDGFFERNGYLCFIEAKDSVDVSKAQLRAYKKMTAISQNIIVFCIDCDAETMSISSWYAIHQGQVWGEEYGDLAMFNLKLKEWSDMADNHHFERIRAQNSKDRNHQPWKASGSESGPQGKSR